MKRQLTSFLAVAAVLALLVGCSTGAEKPAEPQIDFSYRDATLPPEERASILLAQLSVEDKIGQMTQVARDYLASVDDIRFYRLGSVLSGGGSAPRPNTVAAWREMTDTMQRAALSTDFGIPLLYGSDSVHGHGNLLNAVIFPHHIGLGAADDPELTEAIARAAAVESAATGVRWNFAPALSVPQDIRWGRTYEGFSSDPEIVARLGAAEVRGFQWDLGGPAAVLATAKHFAADGGTEGGVDRGDAQLGEGELFDTHIYPYLPSLAAGAGSVMASFSSINGEPMHANRQLITEYLKGELDFDGFVVSDWGAVKLLPGDSGEQIASAINAGIDMVMVPDDYQAFIRQLAVQIEEGTVPMERIDDAVYRILLAKFRMGLFEHPFADPELEAAVGSGQHRELARTAVARSLVLLKNDGVLPIADGERILVAGAFADDIGAQSGGWTLEWQGRRGNDNEGTGIVEALRGRFGSESVDYIADVGDLPRDAAEEYALIVYVTGEEPYAEMMGDRDALSLTPVQIAGFRRLETTGIPVAVLIISGRPVLLGAIAADAAAIVACWLPGTEGAGIADVLAGDLPFTGSLPYAWPGDEAGFVQNLAAEAYAFPRGFGLAY
jgi:beta-glucosidase